MYGHRDYIIWLVWSGGGALAAFLCCLWALWRGGRSEQAYAGLYGSAWILSALVDTHTHPGPNPLIMTIDVATLIGFATLSLYDRKLWIAFATACQLNDVITHLVGKAIPIDGYAYVTMIGIWGGWAQTLCLFIGMLHHEGRLKRLRPVPSSAGISPPGSVPPHS